MNSTKKKIMILALSASLAAACISYDELHIPYYVICEDDDLAFGEYSKGKVYIGSKTFLNSLSHLSENDILVEDLRNCDDPNMKIYNSCAVTDRLCREEIIEILCKYEEMYPSNWDRSKCSLKLEWLAHNFFHSVNYETHRTTNVDLNNNDEDVFNNVIIKTLLRR